MPSGLRWGWPRKWVVVLLVGAAALATAWFFVDRWYPRADDGPATYVGSQTCASCHTQQHEQWTGSHHQLAMTEATPATVRGNFRDQQFTHQGITSRLFRDGDRFCIHTEGPTGKLETFPIKYTFGVKPLQQYLVEFPRGRVQALSIAWDTAQKRWFHLYPDEKIPHDDWLHWTRPGQNWNYMCSECHSTGVRKNYDLASDTYRTTFTEISVGCEACHGPGSVHVALAGTLSFLRDQRWDRSKGYGLTPATGDRMRLDNCARCHARRGIVSTGFQPGDDFLDHYSPELLDNDLYFADGQIRDEVFEYGSFLQSHMYRKGVRCTDCHEPHSGKLRAEGNNLCGRCHVPAKYDQPTHHHHQPGSRGAQCVECHMPTRTYMVVHPRRDHSIRVPRPDLSIALGTPNACNACHKDKKPEWSRDHIAAWFGPVRAGEPHYGHALAAGRAGKPEGEKPLRDLLRRSDVGPLVRASAASLLGRYPGAASRDALRQALADPEALVRYGAVRRCENLSGEELCRFVAPLLKDRVRLVRTEAVRVLSAVPPRLLSQTQQKAFARALEEYEQAQLATADQASAHHNLGVVRGNRGDLGRAEAAYRTALRLDPRFAPARFNLAMLYHERNDPVAAERALRQVIVHAPAMADAHYSLGLLLAEDPTQLGEAARALGEAARLAPNRARIQYNHGLALQRLDRPADAEKALLAAHRLEPAATDYLYALAVLCTQQKRWPGAQHWVAELIRLEPDNPEWRGLQQHIAQLAK